MVIFGNGLTEESTKLVYLKYLDTKKNSKTRSASLGKAGSPAPEEQEVLHGLALGQAFSMAF